MKEKHPLFACQVGRHLAKQVRPLWKSLLLAANTALTKTHGCLKPTGNFWGDSSDERRNTLKSTYTKTIAASTLKSWNWAAGHAAMTSDQRKLKM